MALNPELILLDEPFSGIDTMLKAQNTKRTFIYLKSTHKQPLLLLMMQVKLWL